MSAETATISRSPRTSDRFPFWGLLALGFATILVPTLISLGREPWSTEAGAHGPIVLATGLWLLHYNGLRMTAARPDGRFGLLGIALLVVSLPAYAFGRAYDFIALEATGLYGVFLAIFLRLFGFGEVRRQAFPLFYLAFVIPIPGFVLDRVTAPLQMLVSWASGLIMNALGYPMYRQGVTLVVAQYQLLVEDACAGMNSIVGLTAVSLLYIYLMRRASLAYALGLMLLILPVAIIVNIIRVSALVAITYHFGDAAAQGFMHATTGIVLFGLAVLIIFAIDSLIHRFLKGKTA